MDFSSTRRVFTGKEAHAAFPPRPLGSKININAQKACQMALKWESFSYEGFNYKLSSRYVQQHLH